MKRLVFTGKRFEFRPDEKPEPVSQLGEMPKNPQKVRRIKREHMSIIPTTRTKHNGYRPATLIDLCTDQCRYSVADGIMCGVKVVSGKSWCAGHDAIVHGRFMEAAE